MVAPLRTVPSGGIQKRALLKEKATIQGLIKAEFVLASNNNFPNIIFVLRRIRTLYMKMIDRGKL